jgi:hypothetical protein
MFRNRKRRNVEKAGGLPGTRLASLIVKWQRGIAGRLNAWTASLSLPKLKFGLLLFCLIACGYSAYLILKGMSARGGATPALHFDQTSLPKHWNQAGDVSRGDYGLDTGLREQLRSFKNYIDSLATNDRMAYDSMLLQRTGLMDTVRALEEIYQLK